ncbi:hypothetical protein OKW43_008460 [Paraburkholderia sp. WC7.3g]|uniref:Uncharacterized protein n=1 Tax=Paraburkholderia podalyriae TaxID=1938811 RepID=A0ABR7PZ86_9BURK|nr:hypothetical protein [Paraburkholderia podalyriae]
MDTQEKSLRWLIEKWVAPTPSAPVRLTRYSRAKSGHGRCVRVESLRDTGSLTLFFFRHDDGFWCVFPPSSARPAMRAYALAA